LEYLVNGINQTKGEELFKIITPNDKDQRGGQLSVVCAHKAKDIFNYITRHGVIGDWREPNVIRLAPVPLYNSFKDVFNAAQILASAIDNI